MCSHFISLKLEKVLFSFSTLYICCQEILWTNLSFQMALFPLHLEDGYSILNGYRIQGWQYSSVRIFKGCFTLFWPDNKSAINCIFPLYVKGVIFLLLLYKVSNSPALRCYSAPPLCSFWLFYDKHLTSTSLCLSTNFRDPLPLFLQLFLFHLLALPYRTPITDMLGRPFDMLLPLPQFFPLPVIHNSFYCSVFKSAHSFFSS